jgi:hypothetical protein
MRRPPPLLFLCLLGSVAACDRGAGTTFHATVTGAPRSRPARLDGQAQAAWCPGPRWLQVLALHGDSGLALVLRPAAGRTGPALAGSYPVRRLTGDSAADGPATRPSAAVGLRWVGRERILGFQGDSGTVVVERVAGDTIAGRVRARLRLLALDSVARIDARFQGVPMQQGGVLCRTDSGGKTPERTADRLD